MDKDETDATYPRDLFKYLLYLYFQWTCVKNIPIYLLQLNRLV